MLRVDPAETMPQPEQLRRERDQQSSAKKSALRAETVMLLLFFGFGTAFVLVTPPFQVPDEPSHFLRAYALSEGAIRIRTYGGVLSQPLPASLLEVATALTE